MLLIFSLSYRNNTSESQQVALGESSVACRFKTGIGDTHY